MTPVERGAMVRRARRKAGLDSGDIAAELGVSQSLICSFERGTRNLSPRLLMILGRMFWADRAILLQSPRCDHCGLMIPASTADTTDADVIIGGA